MLRQSVVICSALIAASCGGGERDAIDGGDVAGNARTSAVEQATPDAGPPSWRVDEGQARYGPIGEDAGQLALQCSFDGTGIVVVSISRTPAPDERPIRVLQLTRNRSMVNLSASQGEDEVGKPVWRGEASNRVRLDLAGLLEPDAGNIRVSLMEGKDMSVPPSQEAATMVRNCSA
ncbi:MAG: hypothetical protein KDE55_20800 [Novosphingobium sp.]|nr:hypothetical protein [Novosphingobium sp.]